MKGGWNGKRKERGKESGPREEMERVREGEGTERKERKEERAKYEK